MLCLTATQGREVFVAVDGDDDSTGERGQPVRTIGSAAALTGPGDVCIIGPGTYFETLRPPRSGHDALGGIRFEAAEPGTVIISGADPLSGGWTEVGGGVWSHPCGGAVAQVLWDSVAMHEARWPNAAFGQHLDAPRAEAGEGTGYEVLASPSLPSGNWNGARVRLWPGDRWTNSTRRIVDYQPGVQFRFDRDFRPKGKDKFHKHGPFLPRQDNPFVLFGARAGLDAPGEWCFDEAAGRLLVIPPEGQAPTDGVVAVKRRTLGVDLSALSFITVSGLRIIGAGVSMAGSEHCRLSDCQVSYPDCFRDSDKYTVPSPANRISGEGNAWRDCLVSHSAGTGIQVRGTGNTVEGCVIHDTNLTGSNASALCLNDSERTVVRECSVFRSGRSLIRHYRVKAVRLEYNDLYQANRLTNDCGATYAWGTDGEGSVIAHNWVHDNTGESTAGIYLDNFCGNFRVHHNVLWNQSSVAIRLNSDALNHLVANNTIIQPRAFGTFTYAGRTPTQKGTRIVNNLVIGRYDRSDPRQFVQGDLAPKVERNAVAAIDGDGVPTSGSAAVDAGLVISGIADGPGVHGAAPDIGAYERGAPYWRPGGHGPLWWPEEDVDWPTRPDLAHEPPPPLRADTMIREGLLLWLDAAAAATVEAGPGGEIRAWRDRSGRGHDPSVGAGLRMVTAAPGAPAHVSSEGRGALRVEGLRATPGPMALYMVCSGPEVGGEPWQRLAAASGDEGEEWVAPNWVLMRPGAKTSEPFPRRLFVHTASDGLVLSRLTIGGSSTGPQQFFRGRVFEVLLFSRTLEPDEQMAVEAYLETKWRPATP